MNTEKGYNSEPLENYSVEQQEALGIEAELGKKKELSLPELFRIIETELAEANPGLSISADDLVEAFEREIQQSGDLSENGGKFYNYLAQHALYKPNKEYKHVPQESGIAHTRELQAGTLQSMVDIEFDEQKRIAQARKSLDWFSAPYLEPNYYETQEDGYKFQSFNNRVDQATGDNAIDETVLSRLEEDGNYTVGWLSIFNKPSGKTIDLNQLLPSAYSFRPASMIEVAEDWDRDTHKQTYTRVPRDLKNYKGAKDEGGNFGEVSGVEKVNYGNLTKKGHMLALLHEIAHAWQSVHHEQYGRYKFEEFLKVVTRKLRMVDSGLRDMNDAKSEDEAALFKDFVESAITDLQTMGVEVDSDHLYHEGGEQFEPGQYALASTIVRHPSGSNTLKLVPLKFSVRTDKMKPLIEDYVRQERDAWAHANKVLRFFRKQGVDLEPELASSKDIQQVVHDALGSYQTSIESEVEPTKDIRKFTRTNLYREAKEQE